MRDLISDICVDFVPTTEDFKGHCRGEGSWAAGSLSSVACSLIYMGRTIRAGRSYMETGIGFFEHVQNM